MAVTINASTSAGLVTSADTSGNLDLQSGGVTKASVTSSGLNVAGALTVNGVAPTYGKVLQVVSSTFSNQTDIASTSYTDVTGSSLSITPSSATSKILIMVNLTAFIRLDATGLQTGSFQILRGGSSISVFGEALKEYNIPFGVPGVFGATPSFTYLDSPATTSSTTYSIQAKCYTTASTGRVKINESGAGQQSTITLMEIVP
jgi:hypothetical protein